ncbi:MAG: type II toxin-antitoxin system VapC family toxin [Xanthomonadales bacterium]|nr:type II toxin-antitoxin system VapC family toxin [Xanthomonadales bacterium]
MVLVDTSVWIDHLRAGEPGLEELLGTCQVLMHPFVLGELACGNLHNRVELIRLMRDLPQANVASNEEVLFFIDQHSLMGCGLGYVDIHLLAATALTGSSRLWTRDKRLQVATLKLGIA